MSCIASKKKFYTQYYFDYDMFGRDIRIEFYNEDNPEQTVEEFYCSDENATDEELGQIKYEKGDLIWQVNYISTNLTIG